MFLEDGIDLGKKRDAAFKISVVRRPSNRALCILSHGADERRVGEPGILGDYEFWIVIEIPGCAQQQEGIRRVGRWQQNVGVGGFEPLYLGGERRRLRLISNVLEHAKTALPRNPLLHSRAVGAVGGVLMEERHG